MDGVKRRAWRDKIAEHRTVERHTREVRDVPPDVLERIEALEAFARAAADKVNKIEADYHAARQEIEALSARLNAILAAPDKYNLAPMAHYHDTKGVQAA